ncbi:MAG TPA: hypothetical protein VFV92_13730 [Candidatus Bathyarchaeia archaeon]|nr:hypothetical protein [Candidatus Bathyarchaeia archaeon]
MARMKRMVSVVCVLSIALLLSLVDPLGLPSVPSVRAASETIYLVGYAYGWNQTNPTITVTEGDTITVNLTSGDGLTHDFFVDVDHDGVNNCPPDAGCSAPFWGGHPASVTFTVNFAPGIYRYICHYHPVAHNAPFVVQPLPDFKLTSNPSSLTIAQNSSSTSTMNVTAIGNFSGNVTLTASVSPAGPTMTFSPGMVTLSSTAQSTTSKLTVSVPAGTASGSYSVLVAGNNGTVSRTTTVQVTVSANGGSSSWGLPAPILFGVIAAGIIAAAAATVYIYRRRSAS